MSIVEHPPGNDPAIRLGRIFGGGEGGMFRIPFAVWSMVEQWTMCEVYWVVAEGSTDRAIFCGVRRRRIDYEAHPKDTKQEASETG